MHEYDIAINKNYEHYDSYIVQADSKEEAESIMTAMLKENYGDISAFDIYIISEN